MQVCLSKVDFKEYPDMLEDTDSLFYNDGEYYWYRLDITEDGIKFTDTVGRMVPVDKDSLRELEMAVHIAHEYHDVFKKAAEMVKTRIEQLRLAARTFTK